MKHYFFSLALVALLLATAACQSAATPSATTAPTRAATSAPTPAATATAVSTPAASPVMSGMEGSSIAIALNEQNASGQKGVAILTAKGEQTEVVLQATTGISQANHIHTGSCAQLGNVAYPLTNMADGKSITTVNVKLETLLTGGFAVNLHKAGEPSVYTACGDLPASGQFIVVALKEQNASGQTGVATLVARGQQTEVMLMATPGISQANHIHNGSCAQLGNVAYPLTNMADGMSMFNMPGGMSMPNMPGGISMTTVNATLDALRTSGFAINLHKADNPAVYTACGDIPAKS